MYEDTLQYFLLANLKDETETAITCSPNTNKFKVHLPEIILVFKLRKLYFLNYIQNKLYKKMFYLKQLYYNIPFSAPPVVHDQ
jgi:hypothetical protein